MALKEGNPQPIDFCSSIEAFTSHVMEANYKYVDLSLPPSCRPKSKLSCISAPFFSIRAIHGYGHDLAIRSRGRREANDKFHHKSFYISDTNPKYQLLFLVKDVTAGLILLFPINPYGSSYWDIDYGKITRSYGSNISIHEPMDVAREFTNILEENIDENEAYVRVQELAKAIQGYDIDLSSAEYIPSKNIFDPIFTSESIRACLINSGLSDRAIFMCQPNILDLFRVASKADLPGYCANLAGHCFICSNSYSWSLCDDSTNIKVLKPTLHNLK